MDFAEEKDYEKAVAEKNSLMGGVRDIAGITLYHHNALKHIESVTL